MTKQEIKRELEARCNNAGTITMSQIGAYRRKNQKWVRELVKDLPLAEKHKGNGSKKEYYISDVAGALFERHNAAML